MVFLFYLCLRYSILVISSEMERHIPEYQQTKPERNVRNEINVQDILAMSDDTLIQFLQDVTAIPQSKLCKKMWIEYEIGEKNGYN